MRAHTLCRQAPQPRNPCSGAISLPPLRTSSGRRGTLPKLNRPVRRIRRSGTMSLRAAAQCRVIPRQAIAPSGVGRRNRAIGLIRYGLPTSADPLNVLDRFSWRLRRIEGCSRSAAPNYAACFIARTERIRLGQEFLGFGERVSRLVSGHGGFGGSHDIVLAPNVFCIASVRGTKWTYHVKDAARASRRRVFKARILRLHDLGRSEKIEPLAKPGLGPANLDSVALSLDIEVFHCDSDQHALSIHGYSQDGHQKTAALGKESTKGRWAG
jgi:hypothetical protein